MGPGIIKNKKQYQEYLNWVDKEFEKRIKPDSVEGEKIQKALQLIKQYEDANYPIPPSRINVARR
jgi:HTH-type transcriptional regulator/antitoxin HigA